MKKGLIIVSIVFIVLYMNFISAACQLDASFINQDPYPAVPGDYVKLLFQLKGIENPDCDNVYFELVEEYPISFDPGVESVVVQSGGTYAKSYSSYLTIPFKVRVDQNALDGDTPLEIRYGSSSSPSEIPTPLFLKEFDLNVKDVRTDFEIFIKNYVPSTNILTFEILNIGYSDVEALTIEVPNQKGIEIKGASRNIVGSLDSNDFSTAEFEAIPEAGNIDLVIYYTDEINVRRNITKSVSFDPRAFEDRNTGEKSNFTLYLIIFIIIAAVVYYFYRKRKHEKRKNLLK